MVSQQTHFKKFEKLGLIQTGNAAEFGVLNSLDKLTKLDYLYLFLIKEFTSTLISHVNIRNEENVECVAKILFRRWL